MSEKNHGQYREQDFYCDYWERSDHKRCNIHTCPLIGDHDELVYALQMPFIQVIEWFTFTIATRCEYHKWVKSE